MRGENSLCRKIFVESILYSEFNHKFVLQTSKKWRICDFLQYNKCMLRIRTHFVSGILPTGNTAQAITISKFRTDIENVITGVKCSLKHQGYILFLKKMRKYYSSKATDTKNAQN